MTAIIIFTYQTSELSGWAIDSMYFAHMHFPYSIPLGLSVNFRDTQHAEDVKNCVISKSVMTGEHCIQQISVLISILLLNC